MSNVVQLHPAKYVEPRYNEEACLQGICCDCGKPSKKWTQEEIDAAKEDMGMGDDDDFCDVCDECMKKYLPSIR